MNFKAYLFDFDGVLADTMEDNFLAWKWAFSNYYVEIRREDYLPLEGMKVIEIARKISKDYNLDTDPNNLVSLKNKYYLENHNFRFYPYVEELINHLKSKGKLLAIITASPKEKVEKTIPKDFLMKFDFVVSGDDVERGKPHPEPYLAAMENLKVGSNESVVIENAPLGVKSAKSSGAYCIAITSTLGREFLREADYIAEDIKELYNRVLKEL